MDLIRTVSMMLYRQKKDQEMTVSGTKLSQKMVEKMNPNWNYQCRKLMHQGYEVAQETQTHINLKKNYREIRQQQNAQHISKNLLTKISIDQKLGFEYKIGIKRTEPSKQDERKPYTELDQRRADCFKSKRKLLAIEDQYAALKKLKMVARRGRCN